MTDTPDEPTEPTEHQLAIQATLADRFKSFTFKVSPPFSLDDDEGETRYCALTVRRRPKDEWFKLKTCFPARKTAPQENEQLLRKIERELMMWGDGSVRDREPDGAPQYPNLGRRY